MFIDLVRKRRSIRKFMDRPVEQDKVDLLIETALRAPSSRGFNPWQFVVVRDPETLGHLSRAKPHGASFLRDAPMAIVICADSRKSDVWIEDASIAAIMLHLAATDLGLGSCWIQIRLRDHNPQQQAGAYVSELLDLARGLEVLSIIAIGYPDEQKEGHAADSLQYDKVVRHS